MTDAEILEAFEMPGLNIEASFEPRELELFLQVARELFVAPTQAADARPVAHCMCPACKDGLIHASDCAVHNSPALSVGKCSCGIDDARPVAIYQIQRDSVTYEDVSHEEYEQAFPDARRIVYATRDAAPGGNWPFAEIRNILQTITLLCEESGEPCDGFRFRELVLQARKVLAASAPRVK